MVRLSYEMGKNIIHGFCSWIRTRFEHWDKEQFIGLYFFINIINLSLSLKANEYYSWFDFAFSEACTGFGDPHFQTFDGFFFPFMAEGSFLIVGNKENEFVLNGISRKCSLFSRNTCLVGLEVTYKGHKVIMKKKKEVNRILIKSQLI